MSDILNIDMKTEKKTIYIFLFLYMINDNNKLAVININI